jgi:AcrR family transcriptional regulator
MVRKTTKSDASAERVYGGQQRGARVAERRQRFIEAGVRQFGGLGYQATTVRSLCADAGLSTRYFYESFDTVEALLIASYQQLMTDFRRRLLERLTKSPQDVDALCRTGLRCLFEAVRDPAFARISMFEVLGVSPAVDAVWTENTREFGLLLIERFRLADGGVKLPKGEMEMIGFSLAGSLSFAAIHWMRSGYRQSLANMIDGGLRILAGTAAQLRVAKA